MGDGVVVVGSGFAGFWAAAAARRVGGASLPVTMVAPASLLVVRPRLYEAQPESLAVDLAPLLDTLAVSFVPGAATQLDTARNRITLADGAEVGFGRLVVATGSVMSRPPVPGVEDAFSIDTQDEAIAFDRHLAGLSRSDDAPVIVVVGAGFTGIELALELRDRVAIHHGTGAAERLRVVLVDRADVVGPELGPGPRPLIEAALSEAGVELRLGATVTHISADRLTFAGGNELPASAVVLATGLAAAPFAVQVPGARDSLGRVLVDAHLRAPDAPSVFVAGDAAAADTGDGHLSLASCQHALHLGRYAGHNAAADLVDGELVPYEQLRYVTCVDLGRAGAVLTQGWDRVVAMHGPDAKALKTKINTEVIYPPATLADLLRQSELDPAARA